MRIDWEKIKSRSAKVFAWLKNKRLITELCLVALLLALGFGGWGLAYGTLANADELGNSQLHKPVRLHVLANSDSAYDQSLKLQVRDAIIEYLTPRLENLTDYDQALAIVENELPTLTAMAAAIVESAGYGASSSIGVYYFSERLYGEVEMPAGDYRALKIVLGDGAGKNWWCVLFPPLCFADEAGSLSYLDVEQSRLTTGARLQVKSKIGEIFYIPR